VLLQSGNLIQHLDLRGNVRVAQLAGGPPRRGVVPTCCWSRSVLPPAATHTRRSCPAASWRGPG
jgi:hypothetical protein